MTNHLNIVPRLHVSAAVLQLPLSNVVAQTGTAEPGSQTTDTHTHTHKHTHL